MPMLRGPEEHYQDIKKMREFLSDYKVVTVEQFDRYLCNKDARIKKLIQSRMVNRDVMYIADGMCSVNPQWQKDYDRSMIKAIWVMLDFYEDGEYNGPAEHPSKLRFSKNGEVYDVCVAEKGSENSLNVYCNKFLNEPCKFLVIVDEKEQIPKLNFDGIVAFCIVDDNGKINYYKNEVQ